MNIFNSLGSNYNFGFVLKALFAKNKQSFHSDLKKFLEKKYGGTAILVYKGREAITLALDIILKSNDTPQVAINGFTCFAVYKAIETAGYEAVCLDLEYGFTNPHPNPLPKGEGRDEGGYGFDLNFSAQELLKSIRQNPKIKVVIIQNTLGYPCDIENIAKVCRQNNLILIEDLAHCVGAKYKNGKEAGTVGDFVVLSFSQDKIIDATSGGALIIRNKKYQHYTSPRRWQAESHDSSEVDSNETIGQLNNVDFNQQLLDRFYPLFTFIIRKTYRIGIGRPIHFLFKTLNLLSKPMNESFYTKYDLPNWYCSLVLNAFDNLEKNLEHRKRIVDIHNRMLDKKITSDSINKNIKLSSCLRYPIFVENRKDLINYLKKEGIYVSDIWYDDVDKNLPNAQIAANTILNLPTHINVSENDARKIVQEINQFFRHSGNQASPDHPESPPNPLPLPRGRGLG